MGLPQGGGMVAMSVRDRRIAELAAGGLSHKQIAQQLDISPRTAGAHLYRVFPKLGITSRAALRDALKAFDEVTNGA
ncbi:helix-turn-helix transcriptional regulator [Streptomyces sp. NPDC002764]|uniref:helix-turn-helix domain-containing protein n=2 Tax=Streptomyces TaxID=1883 RepID=UPI00331931D0